MLTIEPIRAFSDNYIWLMWHDKSQKAILIDTGESHEVLKALKARQLSLEAILITHHHYDHVNGVKEIIQQYPCTVYASAFSPVSFDYTPITAPYSLDVPALELTISVISIPGHTLDHVAYYDGQRLFCGDTVFTGGCGRVFEGTYEQMVHSLEAIRGLADHTLIYCGHEYTQANLEFALHVEPDNALLHRRYEEVVVRTQQKKSTVPASLALEKQTNPFLRLTEPSIIKSAQQYANNSTVSDPVSIFKILREWKNSY